MSSETTLPIHVTRPQMRGFLAAILILNIAMVILTAMKYSNVLRMGIIWQRVVRTAFDLGAENNLAAWYSAITLLIAAGVWVVVYALDVRGRDAKDRLLSWGWLLLAVLFCFLSLDEEGSFHERLGAVPGLNQFEIFVVPMALVGIYLVLFAWARLRHSWLTVGLLALGFLTYLSVPLQERAEALLRSSGVYAGSWHTPTVDVVVEEGSELLGTFFFILAGLTHAHRLNRTQLQSMPESQWLDFDIPVNRRSIAQALGWVVGLMGLGFILVQFVAVPDLPRGSQFTYSELGSPPDWFAASLMLITGLVFLYAARLRTAAPGQQLLQSFYTIFALYSFLLSAHHGGGHALSDILWAQSPRRQMATTTLLGLAALVVGGLGIARITARSQRLSLAVWTAVAAAAALLPEPAASLLLFATYGLVLIALAPIALTAGSGAAPSLPPDNR